MELKPTFPGWFKFHTLSGAQGMWNMSNKSYYSNGYYINMQGGGTLVYTQAHGNPNGTYNSLHQSATNAPLVANQWHHIAFVKNGSFSLC